MAGIRLIGSVVAAALAVAPAAGADHGTTDFVEEGSVMLPTFGVPIVFGAVNACDPDVAIQGVGGWSIRLPDDAPDHPYTLASPTAGADADVVWLTGPQGLTCTGIAYEGGGRNPQVGTVPPNADWAYVVLNRGRLAEFTFTVHGLA